MTDILFRRRNRHLRLLAYSSQRRLFDRIELFNMQDARTILDQYFLEMRWRCLSLAADLDRIQRGQNGPNVLQSDPRIQTLNKAMQVLIEPAGNRAEQVQNLFSDHTLPPK